MSSSINDLETHREAMRVGEVILELVADRTFFARDTVGKQDVRSADSIAANSSGGCGRSHFKENQKFCHDSRGSAQETQIWIEKGVRRKLIPNETARALVRDLDLFKKRLNAYIRSIGSVDSNTNDQ